MDRSRNEGFVAVNRLTGGYMAHHGDKRKLVAWVKAKAHNGAFVDIIAVVNGGGEHKIQSFRVERAK